LNSATPVDAAIASLNHLTETLNENVDRVPSSPSTRRTSVPAALPATSNEHYWPTSQSTTHSVADSVGTDADPNTPTAPPDSAGTTGVRKSSRQFSRRKRISTQTSTESGGGGEVIGSVFDFDDDIDDEYDETFDEHAAEKCRTVDIAEKCHSLDNGTGVSHGSEVESNGNVYVNDALEDIDVVGNESRISRYISSTSSEHVDNRSDVTNSVESVSSLLPNGIDILKANAENILKVLPSADPIMPPSEPVQNNSIVASTKHSRESPTVDFPKKDTYSNGGDLSQSNPNAARQEIHAPKFRASRPSIPAVCLPALFDTSNIPASSHVSSSSQISFHKSLPAAKEELPVASRQMLPPSNRITSVLPGYPPLVPPPAVTTVHKVGVVSKLPLFLPSKRSVDSNGGAFVPPTIRRAN